MFHHCSLTVLQPVIAEFGFFLDYWKCPHLEHFVWNGAGLFANSKPATTFSPSVRSDVRNTTLAQSDTHDSNF